MAWLRCLRDEEKKKEGDSEKGGGGENSPISPPLDPRLHNPELRCVICTGVTLFAPVLHFLHWCYT